jgi:hypothetical protein
VGAQERIGLPAVAAAFSGMDYDGASFCVGIGCADDLGGRGIGVDADFDLLGLAVRRRPIADMYLAVRVGPGKGRRTCRDACGYQQ